MFNNITALRFSLKHLCFYYKAHKCKNFEDVFKYKQYGLHQVEGTKESDCRFKAGILKVNACLLFPSTNSVGIYRKGRRIEFFLSDGQIFEVWNFGNKNPSRFA